MPCRPAIRPVATAHLELTTEGRGSFSGTEDVRALAELDWCEATTYARVYLRNESLACVARAGQHVRQRGPEAAQAHPLEPLPKTTVSTHIA